MAIVLTNPSIHHPLGPIPGKNASSSVLLYLPSGLEAEAQAHNASAVSILRSSLSCPVVQINYRLGLRHRYPTPVHDVLAGFDWVVEHLLRKRSIVRAGRSESVGRVAVCGQHIGGGLATMLALTECRHGQPGIVAAALANPVVDWVSLGEAAGLDGSNTTLYPDTAVHNSSESARLRSQLFTKPEKYFDPFASPILFFRSPGYGVPPAPADSPLDDMNHLSKLEREEAYRREVAVTEIEGPSTDSDPSDGDVIQTKRKASKRFPSKALGLKLPHFHISTGTRSPLADQARELTHMLRQSFVRQSKNAMPSSSELGRKVLLENEADGLNDDEKATLVRQKAEARKSVELQMHEDLGFWDDTSAGKARVSEAAQWLEPYSIKLTNFNEVLTEPDKDIKESNRRVVGGYIRDYRPIPTTIVLGAMRDG
ncbi:hypothetical protein LTR37_013141 [Vermiconidia calcicola]|uniref:Uncharacterized protein n=1 Tax=Vermiconidia calcicola TaxID=1690605 RepID=A0ACC3MYQ8_9PEZI|nr:hypothetical protein LTR37_013141 [Vermiconidia calcicola]